jgi:hypothetical protein
MNGVKFSVQIFSEGKMAWYSVYLRPSVVLVDGGGDVPDEYASSLDIGYNGRWPSGWNEKNGVVVRDLGREARETQNKPARAFERPIHLSSVLQSIVSNWMAWLGVFLPHGSTLCHPCPQFSPTSYSRILRKSPFVISPPSTVEGQVHFCHREFA